MTTGCATLSQFRSAFKIIFYPNEISTSLVLLLRVVGNPSPPRLGRARCQQYGVAAARAPAGHVRSVPRPARCGRRHDLAARRAFRAHRPAEHPRLRQQRHSIGIRVFAPVSSSILLEPMQLLKGFFVNGRT